MVSLFIHTLVLLSDDARPSHAAVKRTQTSRVSQTIRGADGAVHTRRKNVLVVERDVLFGISHIVVYIRLKRHILDATDIHTSPECHER